MYMYVYNMCNEVCRRGSSMSEVHSVCMVYSV